MSICRNNHSRTSFNNYYNNSGSMLLWYDTNDKTTLFKSDNSTVTSNGDFVKTIKNKAPKYTNKFNLTSIGTNVNSYNTSLTKPSVFTSNISNTGFMTNGNPLIPTGYTVLMVYKPTGNSIQGNYGVFTKNALWTTADPVEIYNTNHSIGMLGGVRSGFQGTNVGTATATPVLFTSQFSTTNNNYYAYLNGTLNTSGNTTRYIDANVPLYIANRIDTALASSMYLCEFIMYDTSISENARVYMEGYLASKWDIKGLLPTGHTYKATIPPLLPNSYTTLNVPLCWYDILDISTLLNSSNNVIDGTNNEFVKTMKNKAPN